MPILGKRTWDVLQVCHGTLKVYNRWRLTCPKNNRFTLKTRFRAAMRPRTQSSRLAHSIPREIDLHNETKKPSARENSFSFGFCFCFFFFGFVPSSSPVYQSTTFHGPPTMVLLFQKKIYKKQQQKKHTYGIVTTARTVDGPRGWALRDTSCRVRL